MINNILSRLAVAPKTDTLYYHANFVLRMRFRRFVEQTSVFFQKQVDLLLNWLDSKKEAIFLEHHAIYYSQYD